MILARWSPLYASPAKISGDFSTKWVSPENSHLSFSVPSKEFGAKSVSFKCSCSKKDNAQDIWFQDFSVLPSEIPWDGDSTWSTMGLYIFSLHIPLSFGGLSVVARIMHGPVLDPPTQALSQLLVQTIELFAALALLRYTMKAGYKLGSFLQSTKVPKERNWVQASVLGFGFLILLVVLTSFLADALIGPKDVNNPILKEILSSGPIAKMACFLVYCFVTPLLEETVYRGFLLRSLASKMKWQQAVILSSCIFSLAHFSSENSLQLFIIGCVLGCSYCWSGNLTSSFSIHALYNAFTLLVTLLS